MKKQLLLSAIAILFALHLNAQSISLDSSAKQTRDIAGFTWLRNIISVDPLFLAFKVPNVSYERVVSKKVSLYARAIYFHKNDLEVDDELACTIQCRWYTASHAPKGFYLGGFSYYQREWFARHIQSIPYCGLGPPQETIDTTIRGNLNALSFGFIAGYKFIIIKKVSAELYGGGGANFPWGKNEEYSQYSFSNDFQPQFGINVGYAFK